VSDSQQATDIQFSLEKIYVKDLSYEAPNVPAVFLQESQPELSVQMDMSHGRVDGQEGIFEAVLQLTVTAQQDEKNIFLVEVHQAGLFRIQGIPDDQMLPVLEINCPNILLPYAREVVSSLVGHGGFPPLLVNPINFEALFQQRHQPQSA
jgi:preprotein translocase subunit SecB